MKYIYLLSSLLAYGFWAFFPKLSSDELDPKSVMFWNFLGGNFVFTLLFLQPMISGWKPEFSLKGALFSTLICLAGITGTFLYMKSLKQGLSLTVVTTVTAMYPIITVMLNYIIFNEALTIKHALGMGFAVLAVTMFII